MTNLVCVYRVELNKLRIRRSQAAGGAFNAVKRLSPIRAFSFYTLLPDSARASGFDDINNFNSLETKLFSCLDGYC